MSNILALPQELRIIESAQYLGVGERTLRRYIATGRVPARKDVRGRLFIRTSELDKLLVGEEVHAS